MYSHDVQNTVLFLVKLNRLQTGTQHVVVVVCLILNLADQLAQLHTKARKSMQFSDNFSYNFDTSIDQMHFRNCELSFAFMKQNCVIYNSLPPITKKNWSLTFLLLITKKSFMKHPPGLVVTRASCYSCVFSKTRRQQKSLVIQDEKHFKPTLHTKFGDHIRQ